MRQRCDGCGRTYSKVYEGKATRYVPNVCSGPCLLAHLQKLKTSLGMLELPDGFDAVSFTESDASLRSNYELRFLNKFILPNRLDYMYEPYKFTLPDRSGYVPDFLLTDSETFVEVKGLWYPGAFKKFALFAEESGLNVILITRPMLRLLATKKGDNGTHAS